MMALVPMFTTKTDTSTDWPLVNSVNFDPA